MSLILSIETATPVCSVALSKNDKVIAVKESTTPRQHSQNITLFIQEVLHKTGHLPSDLDAIAISKGPGSYTGLRIGVATAKGLCYAHNIPLIAISTLKGMAMGMKENLKKPRTGISNQKIRLVPMINAKRMEVFVAVYNTNLEELHPPQAITIKEDSFEEWLQEKKQLLFFGNGSEKCKKFFGNTEQIQFAEHFRPSARYLAPLARQKHKKKSYEDLAYFEPFYLKDFIAKKQKYN